jgi:hypothetical protein
MRFAMHDHFGLWVHGPVRSDLSSCNSIDHFTNRKSVPLPAAVR